MVRTRLSGLDGRHADEDRRQWEKSWIVVISCVGRPRLRCCPCWMLTRSRVPGPNGGEGNCLITLRIYGAPGEIASAPAAPRPRSRSARLRSAAATAIAAAPRCRRTPLGLRPREFEFNVFGGSRRRGLLVSPQYGAPGEIRTPGLLVRSQALYPTELRAQRVHA